MASSEDDDAPKRQSKRQRLLNQLRDSKVSAKQIEGFLNSVKSNKTSGLFGIPPCDVKEEQFRERYGMVEICNASPSYNRFASIQMNDETLRRVASLVGGDVAYSTGFQRSDGKEQQEAPILDRLFRGLGRFTRPCRQPAYGIKDEASEKKADCAIEYAAISHLDPEKEETDTAQISEEQEGMEVWPQSSSSAQPREHSDLKVSVLKQRHTVRGRRLKVVVDWKNPAQMGNLFQPAVYAMDDLMLTSGYAKKFRPPVYLLAHDTSKWYYGILEIDGYIKVKKRKIDPAASDDFPEKPQEVDASKFTPRRTRGEVEAQFEKWSAYMARNDMYVPDGLHPVGRLFLPSGQFGELPSVRSDQTLTVGQKRYFDGLLKILVGRRVINWTPYDALDAWEARSHLQKEALQTSGLAEKYWSEHEKKLLGRG